jgi:hypothetical protein
MFHGNPSNLRSTKKKGNKYVIFDLKKREDKGVEVEENRNQTKNGNSNSNSNTKKFFIPRALIMEYESSPFYDLYQFGRAIHSTNDFILPGYLHSNEEGIYTGPISRYSFHILCERLPPFRSFIFAGGFNEASEVRVSGDYYPFTSVAAVAASDEEITDQAEDEVTEEGKIIDGFTKYGIKIFQPTIGEWLELSVLGNTYDSYSSPPPPSSSCASSSFLPHSCNLANQLVDGTLLDIGGIFLMFQDPITMMKSLYSSSLSDHPSNIVKQLNDLKAHCPVLFNEIQFYYLNEQEKYQMILKKVEKDDIFPLAYHNGPIHIPSSGSTFTSSLSPSSSFSSLSAVTDHHIFPAPSHIAEDHRSFVFPCCGHVFAYHKSLEDKSCPLCRQHGPFVPLTIAFEPTLSLSSFFFSSVPPCIYPSPAASVFSFTASSSDSSFYVFNPCGHTSSFEFCSYWGNLTIFPKRRSASSSSLLTVSSSVVNQAFPQEIIAICPFCGCELCSEKPFTKLILQSTAASTQPSVRSNLGEKENHLSDSRNQCSSSSVYSGRIRLDWKNKDFQNLLFSSQKQIFQRETMHSSGEKLLDGSCLSSDVVNKGNGCISSFSYPSYAPQLLHF